MKATRQAKAANRARVNILKVESELHGQPVEEELYPDFVGVILDQRPAGRTCTELLREYLWPASSLRDVAGVRELQEPGSYRQAALLTACFAVVGFAGAKRGDDVEGQLFVHIEGDLPICHSFERSLFLTPSI